MIGRAFVVLWPIATQGGKWYFDTMRTAGTDTIAAIATPVGEGAIAVIRISGADALAVGARVFRGSTALQAAPGQSVHVGRVVDAAGRPVDEVVATVFHAPRSYTGEDIVEISCHGGMIVSAAVLEAVLAAGARQAAPGEFTRRAFTHGKMDLAQAEAVAEIIRAGSRRALEASMEQLEGRLGARVRTLRETLLSLCALLEIDLDFSEEGLSVVGTAEVRGQLQGVERQIAGMLRSYEAGRLAREGVRVALAGPPNAGKSSLFNALLEEERAIVTHIPGTTRDAIEESVTLGGMLFRVSDTAGLRETADPVEAKGVQRALSEVRRADIVLLVLDATAQRRGSLHLPGIPEAGERIILLNKCDLLTDAQREERSADLAGSEGEMLLISAKTGEGLEKLRSLLVETVRGRSLSTEPIQVISLRHRDALKRSLEHLAQAFTALQNGLTNEFIAFDLRQAATCLSEITGEITTDDLLERIFSRFCIGK